MPEKNFKLAGHNIKKVAEGHGACLATDMITVAGRKVGYMYREPPDFPADSGWRFFSGAETEEYLNNTDNTGVYEVNTIANYDSAIIPFLDSPAGSAFQRRGIFKKFTAVPFEGE